MGDLARQVTLLAKPTFCFSCTLNGLPCSVCKCTCMKSWLTKSSPGRQVTLLSQTTFLHSHKQGLS